MTVQTFDPGTPAGAAGFVAAAGEDESVSAPIVPPGSPGATFALLLQRMAADGAPGAAVYERLRRRLIVYFRMHLPGEAEALADATFDRLAVKLEQGTVIDSLTAYTLGVARLLSLETQARLARARAAMADPSFAPQEIVDDPEPEADMSALSAALSACLQQLGKRTGDMVMAYYGGDGGERIRGRQRLATELGLSLNALRNRALRMRQALERCVRSRLQAETVGAGGTA